MKSSEWKESPLIDLCEYISRGVTPAYTDKNDVVVLNQKCIRDNRVSYEQSRFTDPDKKNIPDAKYLQDYDILVNSTGVGTLGRVAQINKIVERTTVDSHVTIVRANDNVNPRFLGYNLFLQQANIEALAEGSTGQTELSRARLAEAIKVLVPPVLEQNIIAETLLCLDNKINLNNSINKNLDEIAQAIFKSWFIDFEPFQEGEFEDSELGRIPKGWKVGSLEEVCNIKYGKNLPTSKLKNAGYYVFGGNGVIGYHDDFLYKDPQVLVSCRGAASGKVLTSFPYSFVTNNSLVLEIKDGLNFEFLKYYGLNNTFEKYATGSAQPQITIENIKFVKILIPSEDVLNSFSNIINKFEKMSFQRITENIVIAKIRDLLLPKLMSGEIRVPIEEVQ